VTLAAFAPFAKYVPNASPRIVLDGTAKTDDQADKAMGRICRRAKLPRRLFHTLRHTFETHAALFGVTP
jgi:integrase